MNRSNFIQRILTSLCVQSFILLLAITLVSPGALGDEPDPVSIEAEKQAVLDQFKADLPPRLDPGKPGGDPADDAQDNDPAVKDAAPSRPITRSSFQFEGTGYFSLKVQINATPTESYLGYVVDCTNDGEEDMVILTDLSKLSSGSHTIAAACSDLHKHFPADGRTMAMTPRTDDSPSTWEYWARQAAIRGVNEGYSRTEIQTNIWYITDRSGDYADMRLVAGHRLPGRQPI